MPIFGVVSLLPAFSYFATIFLAYILYKTLLKDLMSTTLSFRLNIKPHSIDKLSSPCQSKEGADMIIKSEEFYKQMNSRRTVRFFSKDHVPLELIQNIVRTAGEQIFCRIFLPTVFKVDGLPPGFCITHFTFSDFFLQALLREWMKLNHGHLSLYPNQK